jgi:hypothetical protein
MHERQAALTGAILALMLLAAAPARAEKDAAIKAQEGNVDHWIEFYRKDREPAAAPPATPQDGAVSEEEREKGKGNRGKGKGERETVKGER